MTNPTLILAAAVIFTAACAGPPTQEPTDAANDVRTADMGADQGFTATSDDADTVEEEFEFGFDAVPLDFELSGRHPLTANYGDEEGSGNLFVFARQNEVIGTIEFVRRDSRFTHRFSGTVDGGELQLALTPGSCAGNDCPAPVPDALADVSIYDANARYDGQQLVFSPFERRENTGSDFREITPTDIILVPNDGFKPAMIPDPVGTWAGNLSFAPSGRALSAATQCEVTVARPGTDYEITAMSCGAEVFSVNGDPGPSALASFDTVDFVLEFDFVEGDDSYRFAATVGQASIVGVIIDTDLADSPVDPFAVNAGELRGMFAFDRLPPSN